jgi:predicted DNA binding CopG/RHH family protein
MRKEKERCVLKKLKEIPRFKSSAEEEKFWATHDSTMYVDFSKVELGFFPELKPSSRTISIRLHESLVVSIKILANKQDVPYQSMLKILLAEKVREALNLQQQKGHVA